VKVSRSHFDTTKSLAPAATKHARIRFASSKILETTQSSQQDVTSSSQSISFM
jgi:hypothetical protein